MNVSIIIPNYNGKELLENNIPSVIKAYRNKKNNIKEVVVVDDASTDSSIDFIKLNYPQIKIIKHKVNRGFSAAVNTGARTAEGELLALLNNDVKPRVDFLTDVLPHFKNPRVFAVSLHEKGYGWANGMFKDGFIVHSGCQEDDKSHTTFWASGGSGVFRRSYWMLLGGFDEELFSPFYWEDVDICYRAAKKGWINLWEPKANVIHQHESTIGKLSKRYKQRIEERNQLLFIWKNLSSPILMRKHIAGLLKRIGRHPGYLIIFMMAFSKFSKVLKARNKEKKESKVSDEAIFTKF